MIYYGGGVDKYLKTVASGQWTMLRKRTMDSYFRRLCRKTEKSASSLQLCFPCFRWKLFHSSQSQVGIAEQVAEGWGAAGRSRASCVATRSYGNMPLGFVWSTGLGAKHRVQNGRYGSPVTDGAGSAHTAYAKRRTRPKSLASLRSPGLGRRQGGSHWSVMQWVLLLWKPSLCFFYYFDHWLHLENCGKIYIT